MQQEWVRSSCSGGNGYTSKKSPFVFDRARIVFYIQFPPGFVTPLAATAHRQIAPLTDTTMQRMDFVADSALLRAHTKIAPGFRNPKRWSRFSAILRPTLGAILAIFLLAQPVLPQESLYGPSHTAEIGELLRYGRQLEVESRWGEAVTYYEDAVRQFPGDRSLQRRFENCRLHFDLGRRYGDRSFRDLVGRLSLAEALDVLDELLLKVQAHYVESPDWKEFIEDGTNALEVALSEPVFVDRHCPDVDGKRLDEFRVHLRRALGPMIVQTRSDARRAAGTAAQMAYEHLGIAPSTVVLEYACGLASSLDSYSTYLTPSQLTEVYSQIEGNFVGLGIELKADGGALMIVRVIPGSPAEQAGILAGDRITAVDGNSTEQLTTDEAANLLQGTVGSVADLVVYSPGQQPRQVRVRRRQIEVPSVEDAQILDRSQGVAYFKLICFQKTTTRDVDATLWKLYRKGMRSLIIDLRGNPGGLLTTSVEVADKFVGRGVIVSTRGRAVQEDFTYVAHEAGTWRVPLVLIIDKNSASAAEIFAGAIRDHRRGTIVGSRSYGKGSVQGIFPLNSTTAGVRLTTAKFYSPNGHPYSLVGVQPDLVVHQVARPIDGAAPMTITLVDQDPAVTAALQAARQLTAQR
jgi:carboxyl-terminal processing protease